MSTLQLVGADALRIPRVQRKHRLPRPTPANVRRRHPRIPAAASTTGAILMSTADYRAAAVSPSRAARHTAHDRPFATVTSRIPTSPCRSRKCALSSRPHALCPCCQRCSPHLKYSQLPYAPSSSSTHDHGRRRRAHAQLVVAHCSNPDLPAICQQPSLTSPQTAPCRFDSIGVLTSADREQRVATH